MMIKAKYFVDSNERTASGKEDYVEFQSVDAAEEFWDEASLYMLETTMAQTGFGEFWRDCMDNGLVFDMHTLSRAGLI